MFNYHLRKLKESGLVHRIINKYEAQRPKRVDCADNRYKQIDWSNIVAAFVIMAAGAVISILVFSLEKILPQALSNYKQEKLLKRFGTYVSK